MHDKEGAVNRPFFLSYDRIKPDEERPGHRVKPTSRTALQRTGSEPKGVRDELRRTRTPQWLSGPIAMGGMGPVTTSEGHTVTLASRRECSGRDYLPQHKRGTRTS